MREAKQRNKNVTVGKSMKMESSSPSTEQTVEDSTIGEHLEQRIGLLGTRFQFGSAKAYGGVGVVVLGIVLVVWLILTRL
jgi:hypothetical protein